MNRHGTKVAATFIWTGFVSAISFMEAWLKFTAPGVSLSTGLAIGRVVFSALNKIELMLAAVIIAFIFLDDRRWLMDSLMIVPVSMVLLQTFALLPQLSARIDVYLAGRIPPPSPLHTIYLISEVGKVAALLLYGFWLVNRAETKIAKA